MSSEPEDDIEDGRPQQPLSGMLVDALDALLPTKRSGSALPTALTA
jgi:hypothetical protein